MASSSAEDGDAYARPLGLRDEGRTVASCEAFGEPQRMAASVANGCPRWCAFDHVGHGVEEEGDDLVHVSGALMVKRTVLRLAVSVDPDTGIRDGPVVYVGEEEYTLYQAEVLIDALVQLVDRGTLDTSLGARERPEQRSSDGR